MAELNCSACEDIRELDPNFVVNGFGDDECTSLKNDTGLAAASGHDDFTDLNLMNDCLVGVPGAEIDKFDVCDWKAYMKKLVPNLWTMIKGIICAIGGIWTFIHKHECQLEAMMEGIEFDVGEDSTDGSYVVAGKGVSFLKFESGEKLSDVHMIYIGGGLARVQGTLAFSATDFTEENSGECWCYDLDGENPTKRSNRKGNALWNNTATVTVDGEQYHPIKSMGQSGELIFEIRIKKSEHPELKQIFAGIAAPTGGGQYQVNLSVGTEGAEMYGQNGSSPKHTVPEGWIYVQARMISIGYLIATTEHHYTPRGFMGIRLNRDTMCD